MHLQAKNSSNTMILIGVTGGIASGKTEVSQVFRNKGAIVLSGDRIGKEIVETDPRVLQGLVRSFGEAILERYGKLDRRRLGRIAFASEESKDKLNRIVHPHLLRELRARIENLRKKNQKAIVVIDAALVVEWGLENELDYLVLVESKREDNIRRLRKLKGYSRKEALDRIKAQLPEKTKKRKADFVIRNDKGLAELGEKAGKVWERMVRKHAE
ncbi:MAG: dephospho-CoA kinase [Candidatus Zixiibacteriota bacterium]